MPNAPSAPFATYTPAAIRACSALVTKLPELPRPRVVPVHHRIVEPKGACRSHVDDSRDRQVVVALERLHGVEGVDAELTVGALRTYTPAAIRACSALVTKLPELPSRRRAS